MAAPGWHHEICVWVLVHHVWQKPRKSSWFLMVSNVHRKKKVSKCSCVEAVCKFITVISYIFLWYHAVLQASAWEVPSWVSFLGLDYYRFYWSLSLILLSHYSTMLTAPCAASLSAVFSYLVLSFNVFAFQWFAVPHTASVLPQSCSAVFCV